MSMILSVLLNASALAAGMAGVWDLKADDETMYRLEINDTPSGTTATWERPEHLDLVGESFSDVSGPAIRRNARSVRTVAGGDVEISFDDPSPDSRPDIFVLHRIDTDHVDVTYQSMQFEPLQFVKETDKVPLGPWDASRTYNLRPIVRPTNPEMTSIFDADQADRQTANIDWSVVGPADDKRRTRTGELLRSGALQSGDDFYHAAFVFQHGSSPDDFLMAHLLAMIAVARGKSDAIWIASATLDRYLQTIGKPQVLGTQFELPKNAPVTQEPYDRTLISDAMRKALHVPSLPEQEVQRRQYEESEATAKKP